MTDTNWRDRALCREVDAGELFFPGKGESPAAAKSICMARQVRTECLDEALTENMRHGIWGGATEHERRKLRKQHGMNSRVGRHPVPAAEVHSLHGEGWTPAAIATRLGVHVDSVRRVLRVAREAGAA